MESVKGLLFSYIKLDNSLLFTITLFLIGKFHF